MAIKSKSRLIHWNYFLALENDLEEISRFIEFDKSNYKTYSIELAHILLASSSEVDVIAKQVCELVDPAAKRNNMDDYRKIIYKDYQNISKEEVFVPLYGLSSKPWSEFKTSKNPLWWRNHNDVKHQRNTFFHEANLKNTINSLGALLIMNFYYHKLKFRLPNFNEVAYKLNLVSHFIRLKENYYPNIAAWD